MVLPFSNYCVAVAVSGAGYHLRGESSTVSLTALDAGFAGLPVRRRMKRTWCLLVAA